MERIFTLAQFTPAEAERIAGVNTALQRDWRRRGFVPVNEGHARFNVFELARMLVLRSLADRGIGPASTGEEIEWCAAGIAWSALRWIETWEGDHEKLDATRAGMDWGSQSEFLRRQLWRSLQRPLIIPAELFVWWADGSHSFEQSFDKAKNDVMTSDPKVAGPVILIDIEALGTTLMERAARPLVCVETIDDPAEQAAELLGAIGKLTDTIRAAAPDAADTTE